MVLFFPFSLFVDVCRFLFFLWVSVLFCTVTIIIAVCWIRLYKNNLMQNDWLKSFSSKKIENHPEIVHDLWMFFCFRRLKVLVRTRFSRELCIARRETAQFYCIFIRNDFKVYNIRNLFEQANKPSVLQRQSWSDWRWYQYDPYVKRSIRNTSIVKSLHNVKSLNINTHYHVTI